MNYNEVEVLLVEDNSSDAELTIRALTKSHLANHLLHVMDGAEALDFLFAQGAFTDRNMHNLPKVILLDLKMPKVDGLEVLKIIKSDIRTQAIPVIVMTSSKQDQDIGMSYKYGVNGYILKPIEFDAFAKAIADAGLYWLIVNQPPQ